MPNRHLETNMSNQQGANRAYSMSQWQRDFAAAFAAGVPLEAAGTQARGPLLAAENDEPEPLFSEAELIEGDRQRQARKSADAPRLERELRELHVQMDRRTT
jgi:hypothetical protein